MRSVEGNQHGKIWRLLCLAYPHQFIKIGVKTWISGMTFIFRKGGNGGLPLAYFQTPSLMIATCCSCMKSFDLWRVFLRELAATFFRRIYPKLLVSLPSRFETG